MQAHFLELADYNRWANQRIYAAAGQFSEAERQRDVGAYFSSLHGTLAHILVADRIWLARMTGDGSFPGQLDARLSDDLAELDKMAKAEADRLAAHVEALPILTDPRHLAITTGVIATQRDDKHV